MGDTKFQCHYCGQRFVSEKRFIKHRCKQMIRDEQFRSVDGQSALHYYQKWMQAYRRGTPKPKSFLDSKYFNAFYRFAEFVKQVQLPNVDLFIKMMKDDNISPTLWTHDQVYSKYLEQLDRKLTPFQQAEISINTLFDLAEQFEIDISDIFDHVEPNRIIQLIRQRKLSPWFLLNSPKFKNFFINNTNIEQRVMLESIIRPQYWKEKFANNKSDLRTMKKYVEELNL